jgi:hypothetical protein
MINDEFPLELARNPRESITYFRPAEEIKLTPDCRFLLPSEKGKGWRMRVIYDNPVQSS